MARWESQEDLLPSVLDRLIDLDPKNHFEAPITRAQAFRNLKASLKRDLEFLLNTRRTIVEVPEWAQELAYSLHNYGVPDFSSFSIHSTQDKNRLLRLLETTIAFYEPRISSVIVTMQPVAGGQRVLRFQIEGLLQVEPAPERVLFDTTLEIASGQYTVEGEPGAR